MSSPPIAIPWASRRPHHLARSRQWLIAILVVATVWGWVDVRKRGYPYPETPEKHKSDLTVYTEAGAAFFDGRPPYSVSNVRGCTYVYPPLFALLLAPLHVLPMQDQVTVWFFVCLGLCWGCYRESRRLVMAVCGPSEAFTRWFPWLGAATLAAATLPTLNCLQRGQVTVFVLYLLLLGLRLVLCGRSVWGWLGGGIVLALPVSVKVIPALPVGVLLFVQLVALLRSRFQRGPTTPRGEVPAWRSPSLGGRCVGSALGMSFGVVLFLWLVPAALIGWNANLRHLGTWSQSVLRGAGNSTATPGFDNDTHSVRNQCLGNAVYRLGNCASALAGGPADPLVDEEHMPARLMDAPVVEQALLCVRFALLLALGLAVVRLACGADLPLSLAASFGLACVAMLVLSPVARGHYFMLWVPAVLFVPWWLDQQGLPRAATAMAVVPAALTILHYIVMPVAGRIGLLGIGSTGWLLAAFLLIDRATARVALPHGSVSNDLRRSRGHRPTLPASAPAVDGDDGDATGTRLRLLEQSRSLQLPNPRWCGSSGR